MRRAKGIALAGLLLLGAACGGEERRTGVYDSGPGGADASTGVDAGPATDAGPGLDGGPASDAGGSEGDGGLDCEPTAGSSAVDGYCDLFELAVLGDGAGTAEARLTGRVSPVGLADDGCAVVDEVEVQVGGEAVGTLAGAGPFSAGVEHALLARGPALAEMVDRCAGDTNRFGGFGLVVRGRMDGGSFEAHCADAEGGGRWPPALTVTCHENVDQPPFGAYAMVESTSGPAGTFTYTTIDVTVPHGPGGALLAADSSVRVIPHGDPWSSVIVPEPFDVTGFEAAVSEGSAPLPGTYSGVYLFKEGDALGTELCPPPSTDPETDWESPPVMIVRITGTGERGAYRTEAFVDYCTRLGL